MKALKKILRLEYFKIRFINVMFLVPKEEKLNYSNFLKKFFFEKVELHDCLKWNFYEDDNFMPFLFLQVFFFSRIRNTLFDFLKDNYESSSVVLCKELLKLVKYNEDLVEKVKDFLSITQLKKWKKIYSEWKSFNITDLNDSSMDYQILKIFFDSTKKTSLIIKKKF